ncbi:hypothetical protein BAUCODRAFT_41620, partial [Baudoinia panamericana UAMH 10762]
LLVLAGSYYLATNYTPPPKSARLWPDIPPSIATISTITGILVLTFILGRLPPFWRTLNKYMAVISPQPQPLSMLGAVFRHDTFYHLAANVLVLWAFGPALNTEVGRGSFLAIFLSAGAVGNFASLTRLVLTKQWTAWSFGASGAVLGVLAATCVVRPNGSVRLAPFLGSGEVPFASWVVLALVMAAEVVALRWRVGGRSDHVSHLGGMATGVAAGMMLR